jgi:hypothetical protein
MAQLPHQRDRLQPAEAFFVIRFGFLWLSLATCYFANSRLNRDAA